MDIKEKMRKAAIAARNELNAGHSVKEANEIFNSIAGIYLSHRGKRDFIKLLNFYADQQ